MAPSSVPSMSLSNLDGSSVSHSLHVEMPFRVNRFIISYIVSFDVKRRIDPVIQSYAA